MMTYRYAVLLASSLILYILLHTLMCPDDTLLTYGNNYSGHVFSVFVAFLVWPLIWMVAERDTDGIYGGMRAAGVNILAYSALGVLFMTLFDYGGIGPYGVGVTYLLSLALTSLNVVPVDFFTKKVIQYRITDLMGARVGIMAGIFVWAVGHVPEYIWLSSEGYGTPLRAASFLLFSGATTAVLYHRTRDISGQMAGHVLMNVLLSLA